MRKGARVLHHDPPAWPHECADHDPQSRDRARYRQDRIDRHVDAVDPQLVTQLFAQRQIAGGVAIAGCAQR
ncbi:hypothetical protein BRX36_05710 [Sphingomonas sp. S-NIH.Pt1_0416]|nr:hypothetical protein BRX36_05710 [Sphingomonas sp. S-NIH.Pt1_0416]